MVVALKKKQTKPITNLRIDRATLFRTGLSHLKDPSSEYSRLDVTFLTNQAEEECVNLGGPNKEFFTLLLQGFYKDQGPDMEIFETNGSVCLPYNNKNALHSDRFFYFGKAVVLSIVSGGPGFPHFPSYVLNYLRGAEYEHDLSVGYITNPYLRDYIERVSDFLREK